MLSSTAAMISLAIAVAQRMPTNRHLVPTLAQAFMGGPSQQKVDPKELREKQALARSQLLRGNFGWLTEPAFRQRRAYFWPR